MAKKNCTNIGGQAVLEGVMMRGPSSMATAVRDSEGKVQVESERFKPLAEKSKIYKVPIIRGVISFVSSMIMGVKIITRATEVYGDLGDEPASRFETWLAKKLKLDIMQIITFVGVLLGLAFAGVLFIFLPQLISEGIIKLFKLEAIHSILKNLIAGVVRIGIFVLYILLVSKMKDIKRLFMYHGAEHKVISCYEHNLPLTVKNAQTMTTIHDRCGTTFLFIVMIFSIIFFSFFQWDNFWIRILTRLLCLPLVAGISYELLKLFAKYDNWFVKICKAPGLWMQKLTTKQPEDAMVEVAITAFNTVMELEQDKGKITTKFVVSMTITKAKEELKKILKDENEIDIILMSILKLNTKTELATQKIDSEQLETVKNIAKDRADGKPLQHLLGEQNFYGIDINVNENVLIPRFDTEILAEQVILQAKMLDNPAILDLCVGSGAIAVAVKSNCRCEMFAADISVDALKTAMSNARKNGVAITFIESDMFESVAEKFDIIVSNPPYIPTANIEKLDSEVKDFEPTIALDGGVDGLDFYRIISACYQEYLNDKGVLMLEVGIGQAAEVAKLFEGKEIKIIKDYNNPPIERVLIIK